MRKPQYKKEIPYQTFNGVDYFQYEGRYFTRHTKVMHRVVWEYYNGPIPKGYHIHHKDANLSNNDISNLELMEAFAHLSMEAKKRHAENPTWSKEFTAKGIEKAKEWHRSPEGRQWHKEHGVEAFAKRKPVTLNCNHCKNDFQTKMLGDVKFCSNNCKSANRKASGIDNVKRICVVCQVEFECNKYNHQVKCKRGCKKPV